MVDLDILTGAITYPMPWQLKNSADKRISGIACQAKALQHRRNHACLHFCCLPTGLRNRLPYPRSDFYFSGKGFQKAVFDVGIFLLGAVPIQIWQVGMVCLLAEQLLSAREVDLCTSWLSRGFEYLGLKS